MNLLGKLFIILIFIGSIVLASFSVVLFATHTNWKEKADTLTAAKKKVDDDYTKLQKMQTDMEAALQLEIKRQADRIVSLTNKTEELMQDKDAATVELASLKADIDQEREIAAAAMKELEALRAKLDGANEALTNAESEWVAMSTELVSKMDEAHSLAIQLAYYESICAQLAKDYQNAVEVLRKFGYVPDPSLYTKHPPAGIQGTVTEVRERGMIEISVGSDSGLVKGHQLDITRDRDGRSSYIAKIEIISTVADRAVAQVMPQFRNGVVQRGDNVTYIEVNAFVAH